MKAPVYKLRIPDGVARLIRSLHPHLKQKIRSSLRAMLSEPHAGKALKEELAGLWNFRVSRFRIIYRIVGGRQIDIVAIGPREWIYRDTFLLVKKGRTA